VHQAITLIAVILRVFSKLAMENATHPSSRVQNAAHYSPAELAGRFETRTAPMVTCGGDADPAGALSGRIKPALIMARPSRALPPKADID
jgi:hypothetical protein